MTLRLLDGRDCSADGVDMDDDDAEDDATVLVVVVYGRDDEVGLCVVFVGKTPAEDIVVVTGFVAWPVVVDDGGLEDDVAADATAADAVLLL